MNMYAYNSYGGVEWSLGDLWKGVRNWAKGATKTAGKVAGKVINLGRNVVKKTEYAVLKKAYEELKKLRRARLIIIKKYGRRLPKRLLKLHNKLEKLFQKIRRKMESLQVEDVEAIPAAVIVGGVVVASVAATAVGWYMMQAKKMEIQFKREALASTLTPTFGSGFSSSEASSSPTRPVCTRR